MNAIEFVQNSKMNFELDLKLMTIKTPTERMLTMSGCGWDEGEEWYYIFPAEKLITEVNSCLKNSEKKSRVDIEGVKYMCRYEVDGAVVSGIISGSESEETALAEFEIDFHMNQIMFHAINKK